MSTRRRTKRNPRQGGYDDRDAWEAFVSQNAKLKGPWVERHLEAWQKPRLNSEKGIVSLIRGWLDYADAHREEYGAPIGDDAFAGPEWFSIGKSIGQLLNMDIGRLDGGAIDTGIHEAMLSQGFTEKEIDEGV